MSKIDYAIMAYEVEKLYSMEFPPNTSDKVIEHHCESIAEFIRACGWTEESYLDRWLHDNQN